MHYDLMNNTLKPSKAIIKALRILAEFEHVRPITPKEFAQAMWPDSPGWRRLTKCGNKGVTRGGAMPQAAGAMLGRLDRAGLITWPKRRLTQLALKMLRELVIDNDQIAQRELSDSDCEICNGSGWFMPTEGGRCISCCCVRDRLKKITGYF
jgi:hypothetical protein